MGTQTEYDKPAILGGSQAQLPDGRPYVVSGDIKPLLAGWAAKSGFTLPSDAFFDDLRTEFSGYMGNIFPRFEFVGEEELTEGTRSLVSDRLPVVSLDRVYYTSPYTLDMARRVNPDGRDAGLGRRAGSPPLLRQIRSLQEQGLGDVALFDDVVFSGAFIERLGRCLKRAGTMVGTVYCGISIGEGKGRLQGLGYDVKSVKDFSDVIDEVCERDFYPGVPLSGRLIDPDTNTGAPYILPFGNPEEWASIPPQHSARFSQFCIDQTVTLFKEIERSSRIPVTCADIGRRVPFLPNDSTRYVDALRRTSVL